MDAPQSSTGTVRVTVELTLEAYNAIQEIASTMDTNETEAFHIAIARGLESVRMSTGQPSLKNRSPSSRSAKYSRR